MKKQGHHLRDIRTLGSGNILNQLQNEFSISTAEELVSAAARAGEQMRGHLSVDSVVWLRLLDSVRSIFSKGELRLLETPVKEQFSKGARLGKASNVDPDIDKYLTRE